MKVGDKIRYRLPCWIDSGNEVMVTITKLFKNDFNFHDFEGKYLFKDGSKHHGKFYFKDCIGGEKDEKQQWQCNKEGE